MNQSKLQSFIESCVNVLIGHIFAVISQLILFPLFDIKIPFHDNFILALYFTAISLIRSYFLRRYFNSKK